MEVEVSRETVWKAMHAANYHLHETIDAGAYPFSWRVQVLMNAWDSFTGTDGTTWTGESRDLERIDTSANVQVAEIEGTRKLTVDDKLVERVKEVAAAERPAVPVEQRSFDENLQAVLEAWNEYHGKNSAGWQQ